MSEYVKSGPLAGIAIAAPASRVASTMTNSHKTRNHVSERHSVQST
jgi:hypothetical protein